MRKLKLDKRRYILILLIIFLAILAIIFPSIKHITNAENVAEDELSQEEILQEIEDELGNQLDNLDMSSIENLLDSLTDEELALFGEKGFLDKITSLLSGEISQGTSLWTSILEIFFDSLLEIIPFISIIIAVALLGNLIQGLKPTKSEKSISNLIHFVTYGIIVVIVLSIVVKMITMTTNTIFTIKNQMDAIFPLLLTLLTAVGGTVSVSVYQPAMALLSSVIINLFTYVLMPLFIFSIIFSVVSNLSNTIKLDKFTSFFNSTFKWITGLIFTIFTAFLSIQGITAGSIDGISIKTAKYAIKSYVPILGSYISDGMGVILASSNLIKNAVGASGLFLLLASIITPILQLVLFMLALKLVSAIIEPLGSKQIANFVSSLSKNMTLLIVTIVGIAFASFITIGLVMCSANIF